MGLFSGGFSGLAGGLTGGLLTGGLSANLAIPGLVDDVLGGGTDPTTGINPFNVTSGVGTASFNPRTGQLISEMSPELQGLFSQGLSQARTFGAGVPTAGAGAMEQGAGFLSQATGFDPFAAAEEQFARLDKILEPGRTAARAGTASGLLATGRLGGSAGNELQASVEGEIERQRQALLGEQFTAAQDVQDRMVGRGIDLSTLGLTQQAQQQALGQGALSSALGIDAQLQSLLGLGSNVTKSAPQAGEQGAFEGILQGGITAGLGALIGKI